MGAKARERLANGFGHRHPVQTATRSQRRCPRGRTPRPPRKGRRGPPRNRSRASVGVAEDEVVGECIVVRRAGSSIRSFVRSRGESGADRCDGRSEPLPIGDESMDHSRRKARVDTGPLGCGLSGSTPRGVSVIGGSSCPRRRSGGTAIPSNPTAATRTDPRRAKGRLDRSALVPKRRARSQRPSCTFVSDTSTGVPAPVERRGSDLGGNGVRFAVPESLVVC